MPSGTSTSFSDAPSAQDEEARTARRGRVAAMLDYHAYAVVALPVDILGLLCGPFAAAARTDRIQRKAVARLLGVPVHQADTSRGRGSRVPLRYRLSSLPFELMSFALLAPAWAVFITRGVLYPIFGADHLDRSWGGPSLAGAWLAHFIQGPPLLLIISLILWPVRKQQVRTASRHLR
ncbi:hypothetical protein I0C86_11370 [Plantactinospora sp. S1510]|uniref:RDD domain-containing protein n=1 Tax=Plantactinospora alkalitolerans TaxID=2789879 RepID=A0ABS0GTN7_9ACTN|nr:hypothetical protein [Plantactinospora alkalitolerans]MBF9129560.1 hypothetical protein [Plantactinospora alkalitolerans]